MEAVELLFSLISTFHIYFHAGSSLSTLLQIKLILFLGLAQMLSLFAVTF